MTTTTTETSAFVLDEFVTGLVETFQHDWADCAHDRDEQLVRWVFKALTDPSVFGSGHTLQIIFRAREKGFRHAHQAA